MFAVVDFCLVFGGGGEGVYDTRNFLMVMKDFFLCQYVAQARVFNIHLSRSFQKQKKKTVLHHPK